MDNVSEFVFSAGIIEALLCQIGLLLIYDFFKCFFPQRKRKKISVVLICIVIGLLMYYVNTLNNQWLNLATVLTLYCMLALIIFEVDFKYAVFYTLIIYLSNVGIEVVIELLYRLTSAQTGIPIAILFEKTYLFLMILELIIRILHVKTIKYFISKLTVKGRDYLSWKMPLLFLSFLMIQLCLVYLDFPEQLSMQIYLCLTSAYLYLLGIVIFIILVQYSDALHREQRQELALTKSLAEEQSYEHLKQVNEEYQQYIHDMDGYLRSMRALAEQSKSEEIIAVFHQIGERESKIREQNYSNNYILDAVIRERKRHAEGLGIKLTVDTIQGVYVDFIDGIDLISMFGNLLDNAIEAASACENGWIGLKIFMGTDHFFVAEIKNNFIEPIKRQGMKIITTKPDQQAHGFGLDNVRRLAEKYGGFLEIDVQEQVFIATLMMAINAR